MTFSINLLIIILILGLCGGFIFLFIREINKDDAIEEDDSSIDEAKLVQVVSETFSAMQKQNLNDLNLSRDELEKKNQEKSAIRRNLKEAAYGNRQAKREIKDIIIGIIQDVKLDLVNEENINDIIRFNSPASLSTKDKFQILLYLYMNVFTYLDKDGKHQRTYGSSGLEQMINDYNLHRVRFRPDGNRYYEIDADDINRVYADVMQKYPNILTPNDKYQIIAQRIFEQYKGFGAVDLLFDNVVDEIDCGMNGIPKGSYDIQQVTENKGKYTYSYESVWIMLHGLNIHLSCLSFGTQEELVRVCQNIYKFNAPAALSRRKGNVISTMKDGSRIVVVRPPFCESWAFFARKFDSTPSIAPEDLFRDKGAEYVIKMIKWIIMGRRNSMLTGDQGTGKTTTLKSILRFVPEFLTLRIQEKAFEMNLRYVYPERNIVTFQETDSITMQEGIDTQKKTNGSINVFGEIAYAEAVYEYLQTCRVASLYGIGTHHAKDARALVKSFAINGETEETVAQTINFDIHMNKSNDKRFCQRITEIVPVRDRRYPSQIKPSGNQTEDFIKDTQEYERRVTDRQIFDANDIIIYFDGEYIVKQIPSKYMRDMMELNMTPEERKQFRDDMAFLNRVAVHQVSEDMIYAT